MISKINNLDAEITEAISNVCSNFANMFGPEFFAMYVFIIQISTTGIF